MAGALGDALIDSLRTSLEYGTKDITASIITGIEDSTKDLLEKTVEGAIEVSTKISGDLIEVTSKFGDTVNTVTKSLDEVTSISSDFAKNFDRTLVEYLGDDIASEIKANSQLSKFIEEDAKLKFRDNEKLIDAIEKDKIAGTDVKKITEDISSKVSEASSEGLVPKEVDDVIKGGDVPLDNNGKVDADKLKDDLSSKGVTDEKANSLLDFLRENVTWKNIIEAAKKAASFVYDNIKIIVGLVLLAWVIKYIKDHQSQKNGCWYTGKDGKKCKIEQMSCADSDRKAGNAQSYSNCIPSNCIKDNKIPCDVGKNNCCITNKTGQCSNDCGNTYLGADCGILSCVDMDFITAAGDAGKEVVDTGTDVLKRILNLLKYAGIGLLIILGMVIIILIIYAIFKKMFSGNKGVNYVVPIASPMSSISSSSSAPSSQSQIARKPLPRPPMINNSKPLPKPPGFSYGGKRRLRFSRRRR